MSCVVGFLWWSLDTCVGEWSPATSLLESADLGSPIRTAVIMFIGSMDDIDISIVDLVEEGRNILANPGHELKQGSVVPEIQSIFNLDHIDDLGMDELKPVDDNEVHEGDGHVVPAGTSGKVGDPNVGASQVFPDVVTHPLKELSVAFIFQAFELCKL